MVLITSFPSVLYASGNAPRNNQYPEHVILQLKWTHQFQFAGYYAAVEQGYYQAAGLDVQINSGRADMDFVQEVVSGNAQYGIEMPELLIARNQGKPVIVLAAVFQHSPQILLTRADANIKSPHDLVGKRVMWRFESAADIRAMLANEEVALNQIEFLKLSWDSQDLAKNRVDAIHAYITTQPYELEQTGIQTFALSPINYGVDFYGDCLFTSEAELRYHADRVKAFRKASLEGWNYAMEHPTEIIQLILEKYDPKISEAFMEYEYQQMKRLIYPDLVEIGYMNQGRWKSIGDTFVRLGMLEPHYSLNGFLYDPTPDHPRLWPVVWFLIFGIAGISLTTVVLIIFNRKLNHKVLERTRHLSQEIAERRAIAESLKQSESLKGAVINNSPVGISIRDTKGTLLMANPAWQKIWQVSDAELEQRLIPRTSFAFNDRDSYLGQHLEGVQKVYESGGTYYVPELKPLIPAPGKAEWISQFFYAIMDQNNQVDKIVILTEDITQRKRDEQALLLAKERVEESEARFKTLHNASFGGIAIHDKGLILDCNQGLTEITGYTLDELIGMDGFQLIAPSHRELVMSNILAAFEKPYEVTGLRKNGEEYPLRLEAREIPYQGKPLRVAEFRDITEQKAAEAVRENLELQLRQAHKLEAVGTMVSGISHELNNILQSTFLYGGMIEKLLPENPELRAHFQHLLMDAERARDIVRQILTFSRKTKVEMKPQQLHNLIQESLSLARASLPATMELKQEIDREGGLVLCDRTQIHQIVINLCNNAQHAMEQTGGTLTVSLRPMQAALKKDGPEVEVLALTVRDTGTGMDAETLDRIFDPFFTTKAIGEGTGLGLSVIHGIVVEMGGQISITSAPNLGASCQILFPVLSAAVPESAAEAGQELLTGNRSILLVDDDESIRTVTQVMFARRGGWSIDCAGDGMEGLELFKLNPAKYDLIVTDLSMPKMSGTELAREIRKFDGTIPIILSTGHVSDEDQQNFDAAGITRIIRKPWLTGQLIQLIQEL